MINAIKIELVNRLIAEHCFWSYKDVSVNNISDEMLIEKTLIYLDMDEINKLFSIFSFKKIKKVWIDNMIPQQEYLYTLNRFLAWYFFKVKSPDAYLKAMVTRHINKFMA